MLRRSVSKNLSLAALEDALKRMERGKAPSIDGIMVKFLKSSWVEVGP